MRYFSMFSGIGGFEIGIEKSFNESYQRKHQATDSGCGGKLDIRSNRFKAMCVGYSEIDKYAIQIYQKHFPTHKNFGDATKFIPEELPDFDLLVAGFPCQSFSIAGKRRGFDDTRGTLFFDICRVLRVKRPSYCLLENVKGLLSHDKGQTFEIILESLDELGYDCQWQVLNSKRFGVPQNRERVFIIGYFREIPRPEIFPISETNRTHPKNYEGQSQISPTGQNLQSHKRQTKSTSGNSRFNSAPNENLARKLIFEMGIQSTKKWVENGKELSRNFPQGQRVYNPEGISAQINSQGGGWGAKTGLYMVQRERGFNKGGKRKLPSLTDENYHQNNTLCGIRRLTPLECERLQGFPDGWTEGISDTQRYKCLGNAVTVNVIEFIIRKLMRWVII